MIDHTEGGKYRVLENAKGDVIQEGDELRFGSEWSAISPIFVGDKVYLTDTFRRPVPQEPAVTGPDDVTGGEFTHNIVQQITFPDRDAAVDALVRRVFGAEPVYADAPLSLKEIMQKSAEEDIARDEMTAIPAGVKCPDGMFGNPQTFTDPHGVFVEPPAVPDGLSPLPPVPEGYSKWEYRGEGWETEEPKTLAHWGPFSGWHTGHVTAFGTRGIHYIEAVKDPTPPPPANPTRDEILFHLDRIINQGADSDARSGYCPDALWLEEARQMIFKLEQDRRRPHSTLTHKPVEIVGTIDAHGCFSRTLGSASECDAKYPSCAPHRDVVLVEKLP